MIDPTGIGEAVMEGLNFIKKEPGTSSI